MAKAKINWNSSDQDHISKTYDDFIYEYTSHHVDWTDCDDHPWQWYMEVSIRKSEGWSHIRLNPDVNIDTVIEWLHTNNVRYKNSNYEFLIYSQADATMMRLKWN